MGLKGSEKEEGGSLLVLLVGLGGREGWRGCLSCLGLLDDGGMEFLGAGEWGGELGAMMRSVSTYCLCSSSGFWTVISSTEFQLERALRRELSIFPL